MYEIKHLSILVVEDSIDFATRLVNLLQKRKFRVIITVESAELALEKLVDDHFDVVLTKISLPMMNGIDLVAEIHKKYLGLPCIMISGHTGSQFINSALNAGACGYIPKECVGEVFEGIQCVLQGGVYIGGELNVNDEPT